MISKSEVYSNNHHIIDELKYSTCKIITSLKISELKLMSILSRDWKLVYKQKGDIFEHLRGAIGKFLDYYCCNCLGEK
jgi:hypothetical protein